MKQGFYFSSLLKCVILVIYNSSLARFDIYEVLSSTSLRLLGQAATSSIIVNRAQFIMPFDHFPTFDELNNLPELFI